MQLSPPRSRGLSLREVLPEGRLFGSDDIRILSCCGESQACRPGDLYTALVNPEGDGHDDADEAIARGAAAVLAERILPVRVPTCVVEDSREAYGRVCQALAGRPAAKLCTIGVTGTLGKTTVGILIASILEAAGANPGMIGTLGACDSLATTSVSETTPPAPQIAAWAARLATAGGTHAVVEASSTALAQRRLAGFDFDIAVLTNLRRDHMDYHGSLINYRAAKARLFERLKPGGMIVINADDAASQRLLAKLEAPVLTIGIREEAEVMATSIEKHIAEQTFLLQAGHETVPVHTRMVGDHHIYNCLSAAAVGLGLGIDLVTIVRGLEAIEQVPGRLERIECGQPFGAFVDYARTPEALAASLKALRPLTHGKLTCVFGATESHDREQRNLLGRTVERYADLGIITTDNPGHDDPHQIAHDVLDGFEQPSQAHLIPDRGRAIRWALEQAKEGDTVIIAGKGNELGQRINGKVREFDDRASVRRLLYAAGESSGPKLYRANTEDN